MTLSYVPSTHEPSTLFSQITSELFQRHDGKFSRYYTIIKSISITIIIDSNENSIPVTPYDKIFKNFVTYRQQISKLKIPQYFSDYLKL